MFHNGPVVSSYLFLPLVSTPSRYCILEESKASLSIDPTSELSQISTSLSTTSTSRASLTNTASNTFPLKSRSPQRFLPVQNATHCLIWTPVRRGSRLRLDVRLQSPPHQCSPLLISSFCVIFLASRNKIYNRSLPCACNWLAYESCNVILCSVTRSISISAPRFTWAEKFELHAPGFAACRPCAL